MSYKWADESHEQIIETYSTERKFTLESLQSELEIEESNKEQLILRINQLKAKIAAVKSALKIND